MRTIFKRYINQLRSKHMKKIEAQEYIYTKIMTTP
jgi:hypothetical protein